MSLGLVILKLFLQDHFTLVLFGFLRSEICDSFSELLLLDPDPSCLSDMLLANLLAQSLQVFQQIAKRLLIDPFDLNLTSVLRNLLVEIPKPKDNTRLVSDTLLIHAEVALVFLDFLKSTEHGCVHLKRRDLHLLHSLGDNV